VSAIPISKFMERLPLPCGNYSAFAPENLTTLPHFSIFCGHATLLAELMRPHVSINPEYESRPQLRLRLATNEDSEMLQGHSHFARIGGCHSR
jgi:hypothetical protein